MRSTLRNGFVWLLLLLVPAGWIALSAWEHRPGVADATAADETPDLSPITTMQGRLAALLGPQALESSDPLGTRPMAHLAAGIVLADAGQRERAEAQVQLAADATHEAPEPGLVAAVRAAVQAWPPEGQLATGALSAEQWTLLQDRMGWFGSLARSKLEADPVAQKSVDEGQAWLLYGIILAGLWFAGAGLSGLALVITLGVYAATGRVRSALQPLPRSASDGCAPSVLGEAFIVWMLVFLLVRVLAGSLGEAVPTAGDLWVSTALTFASLTALAWPLVRGMSWRQMRDAVGLHMPGSAWRLLWLSAASYLCALPFMGLGVAIGQWLAGVMGDRSFQDVSHPVQEMLPGSDVSMRLALFFVASVAAPVVEETAFRGLLYGHVRQQTWGWPRWLSIVAAMLFSATIFAAIHPQGVLAVPALAGVSIGFCITREWSGSVAPGMVAHGVHNGVLLALNLLLNA